MTAHDVNLATLTPEEAGIARGAVAAHRRNLRRAEAQETFLTAVQARYGERPNSMRLHPGDDAPVLVFGTGRNEVREQLPEDMVALWRAWRST